MKRYSVTHFDNHKGKERTQIAWRPDQQTSHALLFENPNHINLIPLILEEAGYKLSEDSVF
jgi:hypothetical protein